MIPTLVAARIQRVHQLIRVGRLANPAHKAQRADSAEDNRNQHPHRRDGRGGGPAFPKLLEIRLQAAGKQDEYHADLGKALENVHLRFRGVDDPLKAAAQPAENSRPNQQPGDNHPHDLRQPELARQHSEQLG